MTAFELGAFPVEVKPDVSGTSDPELPGNPIQTAVSEPLFKCGETARPKEFTENSSPPAPTWAPERVERLTQLFEEGLPTAAIGRRLTSEFGFLFTKNMVIGRLDRMRLRHERHLDKWIASIGGVVPTEPHTPPHDVFNGGGCLWPLGHPGEPGFHFCGHHEFAISESGRRLPYCREHSAIAYVREKDESNDLPARVRS